MNWIQKFEQNRLATAAAVFFFLLLLVAIGWRTYRNYAPPSRTFDWSTRGLSDFHNGTYYPSLAFREGITPYSPEAEKRYPLARAAPPYHPFIFIAHQPFTWFDVKTAGVLFFLYNAALVLLLTWLSIICSSGKPTIFAIFLLGGLLLVSRPGHITLFTGYFTLELVIGTILAIAYADRRPWLAGCGILLAAGKPTYVIPLLILMACRKNWPALTWGIGLSIVFGIGGLFWLALSSDISTVLGGIADGQKALHLDETEFPINTWTRTDLVAMIAKLFDWRPSDTIYLASMLLISIVPGWWLWRNTGTPGEKSKSNSMAPASFDLTGMVMVLTLLTSIYHHSYDCLLLATPWIGMVFYGKLDDSLGPGPRRIAGVLIGFIGLNYLSTQSIRGILELDQLSWSWQFITMLNGICIVVVLAMALTSRPRGNK